MYPRRRSGLALLSQNDIIKGLDACDSLSVDEVYHQCTGALVMEFGEDRLTALGWSMSHGAENSPEVLTVDENRCRPCAMAGPPRV